MASADPPPQFPRINKATADDVPRIESMITAAFTKYIERIGKPPAPMLADYDKLIQTHEVYVLQDTDESTNGSESTVRGSIVLESDDESNTLELSSLVVDPAAQGRGYGRLLIEFAEQRARMQGRVALTLYTNVKMFENLGLYGKLGFVEVGRRVQDGYERAFFKKEISSTTTA
ncbi:acyl-CoA N-acyltransferase [Aspergillus pseudoustus]|uniref:Acyl-CoA N-acyltransferase n=1 Tax=Aspergillus pseudoustus TaxID=1810923 RepID=A0ABR4KJI6_9EURO